MAAPAHPSEKNGGGGGEGATAVPRLRFPEFRASEGWAARIIGQISPNVTTGGTPSTTERSYWGGNIRWMNSGELNLKRVYEVDGRITPEGLRDSSTQLIPPRCVLIGLAGQGKTRGTVAMNLVELCTNQSIAAVHPNDAVFVSDFLYHTLDGRYEELRRISANGEGRGGLNLQLIRALKLSLPTRDEQQKIADCLTSLDDLIAAQGRKVNALKDHKRGLMQRLFPRTPQGETRPRSRFPEFRDGPEWEIKPLSSVAENLDSKRVPITENERTSGEVPYYGASGVVDYVNDHIFDEELLCVSEDGANLVTRTYPIAFSISGKTWVNNHAHVLRFPKMATQKIVELYLNAIDLGDFITGMAQPKLNRGMLDTIPIPLPSEKEQERVADCLTALDASIAAESEQIEALKAHKAGLMQQLFPAPERN